jgi:hypothetical protein
MVASTNETSTEAFSSLLDQLPQLRRLALLWDEYGYTGCILKRLEGAGMPQLEHLELLPANEFCQEEEPLAALRSAPSLSSLHLRLYGLSSDFLVKSAYTLPNITRLEITDEFFGNREAFPLDVLFPNLTYLSFLEEMPVTVEFVDLLLLAPTSLKYLVLRTDSPTFYHEVNPESLLDAVLPRFKQLQHLELCENSFSPEPLLEYLQSLPHLTSLTFGPGAPVSDDLLLAIVKSPTQLPRLKLLTLDYVENKRGPTSEEQGYKLSSEADTTEGHVYPGWEQPRWNDDCEGDGLWYVLRAAGRSGIEVEGTAVGAETWDEAHWGEVYYSTLMWCYEKYFECEGRFEEAIEQFGKDNVVEWLYFFDKGGDIKLDLFGPDSESEVDSDE